VSGAKRTHKEDKLARVYDEEILPVWSQRFGRMILRGLELPQKSMVLDVACATGYPALEIARKMDEQSRLVAIDSSSALLDVARKKAGELAGKRVFFRTERAYPKLPFTADVFDVVFCNLGISELPSPSRALRDFTRVAKPGGRVLVTLPLAGSWQEFYDIFREVLVKQDKHQMIERLEKLVAAIPDVAVVETWLAGAGLEETRVDVEEFTLLFRSAREFFFAPVVEHGPLPSWKAIAGHGQELQDIFWHIKEAIDAYFGGRAFQVTIKAACLSGVKSATAQPSYDITGQVARDTDEDGQPLSADELEPLSTGEVELIEEEAHEHSQSKILEDRDGLEGVFGPPDDDDDPEDGDPTR
jgi:ubiquinone/menaquinone biosynthesis C-methylase UbiE